MGAEHLSKLNSVGKFRPSKVLCWGMLQVVLSGHLGGRQCLQCVRGMYSCDAFTW